MTLTAALRGLAVTPPPGFTGAVLDRIGLVAAPAADPWVVVDSPLGPAAVALSDQGARFLYPLATPAGAAGGGPLPSDAAERTAAERTGDSHSRLRAAYRQRFGRELAAAPVAGDQAERWRDVLAAWPSLAGDPPPLDLAGLTPFQADVLAAAQTIPAGEVRTYGQIAAAIGRPRAVRAVGSALGRNPVPLLIPCHRVVRSDGSPGDYVFGAAAKARLLAAERGVAA